LRCALNPLATKTLPHFSIINLINVSVLENHIRRECLTVRELNQHFIDLWWECETDLPDLGPLYTPYAQTQNEKQLLQFLDEVDRMLSNPPRSREEAQNLQMRLGAAFRVLAEEALGFTPGELDLLPSQAFSDVSEEFVRRARAFDPKLSGEDIYQAGRNAWTANGLQWLLGLPAK
jgi:hypothetical protein